MKFLFWILKIILRAAIQTYVQEDDIQDNSDSASLKIWNCGIFLVGLRDC
jgi:hypothetical protein